MTRSRPLSILAGLVLAGLLSACCGDCIKEPPCKPCQEPNCCNQPNPCPAPCAPPPCAAPMPGPAPMPAPMPPAELPPPPK